MDTLRTSTRLRNVVGAVATGPQGFHDRERERAALWTRLESNDVALLAPRRIGKTSLLRRMEGEALSKGWSVAFVDAQGRADGWALVRALLDAVARADEGDAIGGALRAGRLASAFHGITKLSVAGFELERSPSRPSEVELLESITDALADSSKPWLIIVDELPVLLLKLLEAGGVETAGALLDALRAARLRTAGRGQVRWIVSGSIGLDVLARRHGLSAKINDLTIFRLGPFERDAARGLLFGLASGADVPLSDEAADAILDRLDWHVPYHLQLFWQHLAERCEAQQTPIDDSAVEAVWEWLLDRRQRSHFEPWDQRLDDELGPADAGGARALLAALATRPSGLTQDELAAALRPRIADESDRREALEWLLEVLESDGYVGLLDGRFAFRSGLLREYFRRRTAGP